MNKLDDLLRDSEKLPALPEIYIRVSDLLESKTATAHQIGKALQADPTLTARVLKLINSAYFGLTSQITSVPQAVTLLGHQQLKQLMISSVLSGVFKDIDITCFSLWDFWRHSIKTAIIARHLAMQNASIIDHEAFFTAGLLHDIGRLVIARAEPQICAEIERQVREDEQDVVGLEQDQLGITHIDVGGALMRKWRLPSLIIQCVLKHHEVEHEGPFSIETSIVYLANLLSQQPLAMDEEEMKLILARIADWEKTGCSVEQITVACELADEQWQEVMESLGMLDMEIPLTEELE